MTETDYDEEITEKFIDSFFNFFERQNFGKSTKPIEWEDVPDKEDLKIYPHIFKTLVYNLDTNLNSLDKSYFLQIIKIMKANNNCLVGVALPYKNDTENYQASVNLKHLMDSLSNSRISLRKKPDNFLCASIVGTYQIHDDEENHQWTLLAEFPKINLIKYLFDHLSGIDSKTEKFIYK